MNEPQILRPFVAAEAIGLAEAGEIAGVSVETVRRWASVHHLGRRIGGRWRVSRFALRMYLEGDKAALRAFIGGDRASAIVRRYLDPVEKSINRSPNSTSSTDHTNGGSFPNGSVLEC